MIGKLLRRRREPLKFEKVQKREFGALQWRWRLRAGNGAIIAVSGEAYFNEADADRAIELVKMAGPMTRVVRMPVPPRPPKMREPK